MSRASHSRVLRLLLLCVLLPLGVSVGTQLVRARSKPVGELPATSGPLPIGPPGGIAPPAERESDRVELRVLMVGNSYTMHHTLHAMLQRLAAGVEGGPRFTVDLVARGGYSLRNHLRTGAALQRIRNGHYTHVVLQGHSLSTVDHLDEFEADAERFKQVIDAAASRTIFYATWARSPEVSLYRHHKVVHSFTEMSERVGSAYFEVSTRLGAGLAPVGRAFERSLIQNPKLTLWGSDGSHPSLAGSYMAACVIYGAITGTDPGATSYVPAGLSEVEAAMVRSVAAQSLEAAKSARGLVGTQNASAQGPG